MSAAKKKYDRSRGRKLLRWLDAWIGIPMVFVMGLFKRRRPLPAAPKNVAVLRTVGIGDTVLLSGIVQGLLSAYPGVRLTVFTGSSNAAMARLIPGVRVVELPITSPWQCLRMIRQEEYDLMIDFGPWPRVDALLTGLSRSKCVAGFRTTGKHRSKLFDITVDFSTSQHEYDNYRNLAAACGIQIHQWPAMQAESKQLSSPTIAIHMFPGGLQAALRRWPRQRWVETIDYLHSRGWRVLLTGASVDRLETETVRSLVTCPDQVDLAAGCSLTETMSLLAACGGVISVDTGIMHISAALGCKLISLHGPTPTRRWGPLTDNGISLSPSASCRQCGNLGGEPCGLGRRCIDDISVAQVCGAIDSLLGSPTTERPVPHFAAMAQHRQNQAPLTETCPPE